MALEFVQKKSNEISTIPKLLEKLEVKGHLICVDTMRTQTAIASKIKEIEADYLMALTLNQGSLHDEVIDQLHFTKTQIQSEKSKPWDHHEHVEKSNGRISLEKLIEKISSL